MSNLRLSMSVERLPMTAQIIPERRGVMMATICVADEDGGSNVTLLADENDTFKHRDISAMLRVFADQIDRKHGDQKVAA